MKKQILNIGKVLNKVEQKSVHGGDNSLHGHYASCKAHCRQLYGLEGICIPIHTGERYKCVDGMAGY